MPEQLLDGRERKEEWSRPAVVVEGHEARTLVEVVSALVFGVDHCADTAEVRGGLDHVQKGLSQQHATEHSALRAKIDGETTDQRDGRGVAREAPLEMWRDLVARDAAHAQGDEAEHLGKLARIVIGPMKQPRLPGAVFAGGIVQRVSREEVVERVNAAVELSDRIAGFNPPPPFSVFSSVAYENVDDLSQWRGPSSCAFSLMRPDADTFRAFESAKMGAVVAGQMRDALQRAAKKSGWDEETIRKVVLGHGEDRGGEHVPVGGRRFSLLPLPSIEPRESGEKVTLIRRVMVASSDRDDVAWARRVLVGESLRREDTGAVDVVLGELAASDLTGARYRAAAHQWATVTPVVLPGRDDPGGLRKRLSAKPGVPEQKSLLARLARRRDGLIRKALRQAGIPDELVFNAEIDAREDSWLAGVEPAGRFRVASHLDDWPRLHVRINWFSPSGDALRVAGPLCVGRGRFTGMGLFATQ